MEKLLSALSPAVYSSGKITYRGLPRRPPQADSSQWGRGLIRPEMQFFTAGTVDGQIVAINGKTFGSLQ
jgi:hypothetical protein